MSSLEEYRLSLTHENISYNWDLLLIGEHEALYALVELERGETGAQLTKRIEDEEKLAVPTLVAIKKKAPISAREFLNTERLVDEYAEGTYKRAPGLQYHIVSLFEAYGGGSHFLCRWTEISDHL